MHGRVPSAVIGQQLETYRMPWLILPTLLGYCCYALISTHDKGTGSCLVSNHLLLARIWVYLLGLRLLTQGIRFGSLGSSSGKQFMRHQISRLPFIQKSPSTSGLLTGALPIAFHLMVPTKQYVPGKCCLLIGLIAFDKEL